MSADYLSLNQLIDKLVSLKRNDESDDTKTVFFLDVNGWYSSIEKVQVDDDGDVVIE